MRENRSIPKSNRIVLTHVVVSVRTLQTEHSIFLFQHVRCNCFNMPWWMVVPLVLLLLLLLHYVN